MAATAGAVLTSAIINIITFLIAFIVFCYLRRWNKAERFYDCKRHTPAVQVKPHPIPAGLFAWIGAVAKYPEADIIRQSGLDTAMYLRLLRFCVELFVCVTAWCLVTVLPTNITDTEVDRLMSLNNSTSAPPPAAISVKNESDSTAPEYKFTAFDKLSLANVQQGSHRMWVHLISTYVITIITLVLLYRYSRDSVLLRIMYLANNPTAGSNKTVLVTDVPGVTELTNKGVEERKKSEAAAKKAEKEAKKAAKASGLSPAPSALVDTKKTESGSDVEAGVVATEMVALKIKDVADAKGTALEPSKSAMRRRHKLNAEAYDLNERTLSPLECARDALAEGASPQELVESEFDGVYPGQVVAARVTADMSELTPLVDEYNKLTQALDDYVDEVRYQSSIGKPLARKKALIIMPSLGPWGKEKYGGGLLKRVDALEFWTSRLTWLEQEITAVAQPKAKQLAWPSAFVTFKSRVPAAAAATALHHHDEHTWAVRPAPPPGELVWFNLGMTSATRSSATTVMWVVFWLMTLFFMIPIAAIQGLIDVPKLATMPGLGPFVSNVVIQKLLEAIVPGLALKIFLALVPLILTIMMKKSGAVCESEIDFGVVSRFFIFQMIVVLAGTIIAGSFFSQAKQWIEEPGSVISVLGTAIPQTATFFITFIWVAMGVAAINFLRIVGLILLWLFSKLAGGPKVRDRLYQEQYTTYGTSVTGHTLILVLGLVYSCINPIVTPSALCYFLVAALCERYNSIYVYRRNYESAGQLWSRVVTQVMTALYIFQLCMIGLISIKKFPYSPIIIPVLLPSIGFHLSISRLFARPWALTSLHDAAAMDTVAEETEAADAEKGGLSTDDPDQYLAPGFKVQKGAVAQLLKDAEEVGKLVDVDVARQEVETAAKKAAKGAPKAEAPATAAKAEAAAADGVKADAKGQEA